VSADTANGCRVLGGSDIQDDETADRQRVNKDMTIDQAYAWIVRQPGRDSQVFCKPRQNTTEEYLQVSVFGNNSREQSLRREREHYDRFIGIFNDNISHATFSDICKWACERQRQALAPPHGLF